MSFPILDTSFRYIKSFEYIAVKDILTFPNTNTSSITSSILLQAGANWQVGYSREKKLKYSDKGRSSKPGTIFNHEMSGTWAGSSVDIDAEFLAMLKDKFVIKLKNTLDEVRILGTKETPLTFSYSHLSEIVEGIEGYSYKFTGKSFKQSLLYIP